MTLRPLPSLVALASLLLFACVPYQERKKQESKPVQKSDSQAEQAKTKEQNEKLKNTEEENRRQAEARQQDTDQATENSPRSPDTGRPPEPAKRMDYPTAKKVPGREGVVLSPYNNKVVSIRDDDGNLIPSGKLVNDPTYLESEKKYFRVP